VNVGVSFTGSGGSDAGGSTTGGAVVVGAAVVVVVVGAAVVVVVVVVGAETIACATGLPDRSVLATKRSAKRGISITPLDSITWYAPLNAPDVSKSM
jgi:hypothetical protein